MESNAFDSLLQDLARKDFLTYQHSIAVAEHMLQLAKALGFDENGIQAAEMLGAVHDIAKTGTPAGIFKKLQAGQALSEQERRSLHHTPAEILELLGKNLLPPKVVAGIEHMGCRYDGSGKPQLSGGQIEQMSRMLLVCDYYDMLTRQRTGRAPLSEGQSRSVLLAQNGRLFDPELVKTFLATLPISTRQD